MICKNSRVGSAHRRQARSNTKPSSRRGAGLNCPVLHIAGLWEKQAGCQKGAARRCEIFGPLELVEGAEQLPWRVGKDTPLEDQSPGL